MSAESHVDVRTTARPRCFLCTRSGDLLHSGLTDRWFGAPGSWNLRRCPECGLLWLDPAPSEAELGSLYRHYYTHQGGSPPPGWLARAARKVRSGYLSRRFGYPGTKTERLLGLLLHLAPPVREGVDHAAMFLPARLGGRLLDVGCGSGTQMEFFRRLGWKVEGVDFDPAAVKAAAARGLDVHTGTLESQRYPTGAFDAITLGHVIEHVPDPLALLRECQRILASDGWLVILTPNAAGLGHRRLGAEWRGLEPPRHLHVFDPRSLATVVERAGFQCRRVRSTPTLAARTYRESRFPEAVRFDRRPSPAAVLASLLFEMEERVRLGFDPWAGEQLVLTASP